MTMSSDSQLLQLIYDEVTKLREDIYTSPNSLSTRITTLENWQATVIKKLDDYSIFTTKNVVQAVAWCVLLIIAIWDKIPFK